MCRIMAAHKRILGTLGNGPTRRNLFGPVDRDQLQVEYQAALCKDLEEASARWGYDFFQDKPLNSSDFQWEGIPGVKVPLLYRSVALGQGDSTAVEEVVSHKRGWGASPRSEKENIPRTPKRYLLDLENLEKTPERGESTGTKRKQTNITDFYQAKRRVVGKPRKSGEWRFCAGECDTAKTEKPHYTQDQHELHRLCTAALTGTRRRLCALSKPCTIEGTSGYI